MEDITYNRIRKIKGFEKIECYGDSWQQAITELNNELKRRGNSEAIQRPDGKYTCGNVSFMHIGPFIFSKEREVTMVNLVWHAEQGDKHIVAVFVPTPHFKALSTKRRSKKPDDVIAATP